MKNKRNLIYVWLLLGIVMAGITLVFLPKGSEDVTKDLNHENEDVENLDQRFAYGLKGEYYRSSGKGEFDFGEFAETSIDPNINFRDLNPIMKKLTGQDEDVTIRWAGQLKPNYSEKYTFYMIGDNGFRLWVDDQLIIDHWVNDWDNEQTSEPISLEADQKHDIKIEYFEDHGGAYLELCWESESQEREIVPYENFYLPEDYDYEGPLEALILEDGKEIELTFEQELKTLPESVLTAFSQVGKSKVENVYLKVDDPSTMVVELDYPITEDDDHYLNIVYHDRGKAEYEDGTEVATFSTFVINHSTYHIASPWAEEVSSDNALPEYPRPQMVRDQWVNLNGEWEFQAASEEDSLPTGDTLEETILVPFAVESKLSGIERYEEHMWYKRSFTIPEDWADQDVLLHFGAVDWETNVYVNGEEVGSHIGGYDAFSFNITDVLVEGENELIVEVKDPTSESQALGKQRKNPGGIFYTSVSGIWQTVWLEAVSEAHIESLKMTPDIHDEQLSLIVNGEENNQAEVEAIAYKEGEEVGRVTGEMNQELSVPVPSPRLWDTTDPFLYDLIVKLKDEDETIDEVESYFGMREITTGMVDGILRPLINGEFVFQMGPLDQGYWPEGLYTAPTDEALKYDIKMAKELGFNMIRKHSKTEPDRFYYWTDKMGMLVWQDMPQMFDLPPTEESATQIEIEFKRMVEQQYNSPSIVLWTVFNEGWGQYDTKRITNWVEELDPSRLVSNASGWTDKGAGDVIDVHAYVGPDTPEPTEDRIAVLGEYGGLGLHVPGHEWSSDVFNYEMQQNKAELTNRYLRLIHTIIRYKNDPGLSAAVYTQMTDVETEINGLVSYDRKVKKVDFERLRKAHKELIEGTSDE